MTDSIEEQISDTEQDIRITEYALLHINDGLRDCDKTISELRTNINKFNRDREQVIETLNNLKMKLLRLGD